MLKTMAKGIARKGFAAAYPIKVGAAAAACFVLAGSQLGGAPSALNVALIGAMDFRCAVAGFAGSLASYFLGGSVDISAAEIAAIPMVMALKRIFLVLLCKGDNRRGEAPLCALFTGISMLFMGVLFSMLTSSGAAAILVRIFRAAVCAIACGFFVSARIHIKSEKRLPVTGEGALSLSVSFVLAVSALCSLSLYDFNLGRTVGLLAVLCAVKKYRIHGAVYSAALCLAAVALSSPELSHSGVMMPAVAAAVSLFAAYGTAAICFSFICLSVVGIILVGGDGFSMLVDIFSATAIFALIPDRLISSAAVSEEKNALLGARMGFAADAVADVKQSVERVAAALAKASPRDISAEVSDRVCSKCRRSMGCWDDAYDKTYAAFVSAKRALKENGILRDEDMADFAFCPNRVFLTDEFNLAWRRELSAQRAAARLAESREVLYEQFSAVEELLRGIGADAENGREYDRTAEKRLKSLLSRHGALRAEASVYRSSENRFFAEAFYLGTADISDEELCLEVSEAVGCDLDIPQRMVQNGATRLCFWERTKYRLEIGRSQRPCEGDVCGDTCESFTDGMGNAYVVISDGMGCGKRAALDSVMTASLLKKLLFAGVEYRAAMKLINSSMLLKSSEERFATLDIACIDLYSGGIELIKSGAAATYIRSGDRISRIESSGIPIGISGRCAPSRRSDTLCEGSCVLMMSDGIEDSGRIGEVLKRSDDMSCDEISRRIIELSLENNGGEKNDRRFDDMTAVALKLSLNKD